MPSSRSKCTFLYPDFTVCARLLHKHEDIGHDFQVKSRHKIHLYWSKHPTRRGATYCGWSLEWVPESTKNVKTDNVARLVRKNQICLMCVKNWMWHQQRMMMFETNITQLHNRRMA